MVANGKTNACLTEWFGSDETLAVTFNMDEHLTNVLRNVGKDRDAQQKVIDKLAKNISLKIMGNDDVLMKEFNNMMSGSFTYVTEEYQVLKICVYNSMKKPVIIGKVIPNNF
jgi:type I restriction-modification system DNA methylase subunit